MSSGPGVQPPAGFVELDRRQVIRNFNAAAAGYEAAAALQQKTAENLAERLECMRLDPAKVLDLGAGTGYGARLLARRYPRAYIVQMDFAHKMLLEARRQAPSRRTGRAAWVRADAHCLPFRSHSLDLVFSNFMLQWCAAIKRVFQECLRVLRPGGLLLFSTCGPDTLRELRWGWSQVDKFPHVHFFPDMHDVGDELVQAGFQAPVMEVEYFTLTYPDFDALLRELRRLGSRSAVRPRRGGLAGSRDARRRVRDAYETLRIPQGLPATYEVIYGHAWAVPQAVPEGHGAASGEAPVIWRRRGLGGPQ